VPVRTWSLGAGVLFFLSPISILITGYRSQFENLAILVAFCAILAGERIEGRASKAALLAGVGVSLMIKYRPCLPLCRWSLASIDTNLVHEARRENGKSLDHQRFRIVDGNISC
jgi:hypothetical protein